MADESKQEVYQDEGQKNPGPRPALKVGLIATTSALAGGLAVAWWYRETLKKLQNPVNSSNLPKNGSLGEEFPGTDQGEFDDSEPGTLPPIRD